MRKTRCLAAALLAVSALTAAPATAAPAPLTLGGTVTMTASAPYARAVVLPRDVTVHWSDWTISTTGGRYAGFVLRADGRGARPLASGLRPGDCATRGCRRPAWSGTFTWDFVYGAGAQPGDGPDAGTLPAGRYHLYLVTDGAPVTVRLRLPGLRGSTSVTGGSPAAVTVQSPAAATYDPPATGTRYSAGVVHQPRSGDGYVILSGWKILTAPKSATQVGYCSADGTTTPSSTLGPYQYGCASPASFGASGEWLTGRKAGPGGLVDEGVTTTTFLGMYGGAAKPFTFGNFLNSPVPATEAHTTVVWVDF
jgi:hypothetical protein